MQYSEMLKRKMIQKMTGDPAISATALSRQVDISQTPLSKWLRQGSIGVETSSRRFPTAIW